MNSFSEVEHFMILQKYYGYLSFFSNFNVKQVGFMTSYR